MDGFITDLRGISHISSILVLGFGFFRLIQDTFSGSDVRHLLEEADLDGFDI